MAKAYGNFILDKGYDTADALTKFTAVAFDADEETVAKVGSQSDPVVGVVQFDVTAAEILKGKGASVRVAGITEMWCEGGLSRGDVVGVSTTGGKEGWAIAPGSSDRVIGVALEDIADGGRGPVQLGLPGYLA